MPEGAIAPGAADLAAVALKYHSGTKASIEQSSLRRVAKVQRSMNIFRFP
jgi:hypothetical protein